MILMPLVMETDLGRDADDLYALLYFLGAGLPIKAICLSPGDRDQAHLAKIVLNHFGRSSIPVLTPKARVKSTTSITPYHRWVMRQLNPYPDTGPDGHEELLPTELVDVFVCGPARMAHLLNHRRITMQGGFVPYSRHRPRVTLDKFEGKESCATFNLGGTKPVVYEPLIAAPVEHLWVGKNICHTVVYTPEVHAAHCPDLPWVGKPPSDVPEALRLHKLFVERYIEDKGAKAFHDPLAAVLSYNPDLGHWMPLKPVRAAKGEWTVEDAPEHHQSLVDLRVPVWSAYFRGLQGHIQGE